MASGSNSYNATPQVPSLKLFDLTGKNAVITGASRGQSLDLSVINNEVTSSAVNLYSNSNILLISLLTNIGLTKLPSVLILALAPLSSNSMCIRSPNRSLTNPRASNEKGSA